MDIVKIVEDRASATMNVIKEANSRGDSEVQQFYDEAVVLLTGGSGFLGKQLIEKLIRSTNVNKIYLLLRPKKGKSIQERLKKLLENSLFVDLHNVKPSFVDKIIPLEGDVADLNLGMDEKTWSILTEQVDVIIHAAATVNFCEKIKVSALTNIRGTREMLKFARECKNIKSIVHVSTAYVHATRSRSGQEVKEDFYESPIPPDAFIQLSESLDEDTLSGMITPLMHEWPNTYTFTKAVTEELVRRQAGDLPICIVRSAGVISAYGEPTPGWIDPMNVYGPSGLVVGASLGVMHVLQGRHDKNLDLLPVDYVNNAIIVAAWRTFKRHQQGEKQTIIYTVTGTRNPFTTGLLFDTLNNESDQLTPTQSIWYNFTIVTRCKLIFHILTWLLHFIPGAIIDGCCMVVGKKPRLFKVYKTANSLASVFAYFLSNDWTFHDANTLKLYNQLSQTDKQLYNFDMSSVNPKEMIWSWCYGVKKYILREKLGESEYAKKKQFWFRIAHYIILPLYIYSLFKLVCLAFVLIYNVLGLLISYIK